MMSRCTAALAAVLLATAAPGAFADEAARPDRPPARAAHRPRHTAVVPARAAPARAAPAGATPAPLPGADHADAAAERAASLERRRKAFFSPPPDGDEAPAAPTTPVGVTLGGSGGLTPGLGLKF